MINKYPTRSDDFAGSNDEIDEIKYFIRENGTNRSIPVCFQVVDLSDLEPFDQHWALSSFFEVFKQCMDESDMRRFTWKLVRNDGGDNDIHGIFYSGGLSAEWFLDALLEAAPWNVHGSTERRFRWVGKVLVARFIRESQVRGMSGEFAIHVGTAGEFFARLGFKPLKQSSKVYYITLERATDLLKEVGTE